MGNNVCADYPSDMEIGYESPMGLDRFLKGMFVTLLTSMVIVLTGERQSS